MGWGEQWVLEKRSGGGRPYVILTGEMCLRTVPSFVSSAERRPGTGLPGSHSPCSWRERDGDQCEVILWFMHPGRVPQKAVPETYRACSHLSWGLEV